ncbi:aspartate/glutamate racemase family protein [Streptococcus plurextorum]|uniref:aspartate/glutamate racemase family protein n=1 Tax=Streptococcus plurextorum TaxID=456876 RepID=UPI0003F6678D|nr:aspartate/glutamate racemase family protein [Streptococcus plurextorum]
MHHRGTLEQREHLTAYHQVASTPIAGAAIGIITIDYDYVKLPGNVANATTFSFPVIYEVVSFPIEDLFEGKTEILDQIIQAAQRLEKKGVRAIVGACGYFNHFQEQIKSAVSVPVYMSSVLQIPLIKMGLRSDQKVAVIVADGEGANREFFAKANANIDDCIVQEIGTLESFAPIRYIKPYLDNAALTRDLVAVVKDLTDKHPEIGAVLLECSDLPPYAASIQREVGLPVFDFITLINWVYNAVVKRDYYGYL